MGNRKVTVKQSTAESIAAIAFFIKCKGIVVIAEKFSDAVYDFFIKLADQRKAYPNCKEPVRAMLGYKCLPYMKKYTIVFIKSVNELIICEFVSSKRIYW